MDHKLRPLRFLAGIITLSIAAIFTASPPATAVNYTITQISSGTNNFSPRINNKGQVVWYQSPCYGLDKVLMYDNRTIIQIASASNSSLISEPRINNNSQITYITHEGDSNYSIWLYNDSQSTKISDTINGYAAYDRADINDMGEIVWTAIINNSWKICYFNKGIVNYITLGGQFPSINNKSHIVIGKNDKTVYFYHDGITNEINDDAYNHINPDINDYDQIVWQTGWGGPPSHIYLYDKGNVTKISNNNYSNGDPGINSRGQVVWRCWDGTTSKIYLYENSAANPVFTGYDPAINDLGQIVFWNNGNIYLATPKTVDIPKPTATPPIETFPQPNKLFVDSGTFIKSNSSSFSPDSQQFLSDHQNAIQRFVSKFITSPDGAKNSANFWKNAFNILGNSLSVAAISADAKADTTKGIISLLSYVDKNLWFNILGMDKDYQIRSYVDILTNAKIPTNGYSFVFFGGSVFSGLYTGMFSLIADDPPDPNFTEVFQCPIAITAPFSFSGVSPDVNKTFGLYLGSSYNIYYYLLGLTTSINRYSSALAAGDAISAGLQFQAFVKYLTLYDASAIQTAAYLKQYKQAMINQGLPDLIYNKQDILNLQNQIRLNGLPTEVVTAFKNLGITDYQISELTQAALNYVPPDSVPGSLYSNLSSGVKLYHSASSWRPVNPAISSLLLQ